MYIATSLKRFIGDNSHIEKHHFTLTYFQTQFPNSFTDFSHFNIFLPTLGNSPLFRNSLVRKQLRDLRQILVPRVVFKPDVIFTTFV